jgi:hypothetical protein
MYADLSEFVKSVPTEEVKAVTPDAPPTKKKRKMTSSSDPELEEMRKRAKSYCTCFEQYNSIRRYSKKRLADWLEQKEFDIDNSLKNSVFSFVTEAYGFVLDKLLKGEGHVAKQVSSDLSLRQALEDEGRNLLMYVSNKSKILVLTGADIYHGKAEQRAIEAERKEAEALLPLLEGEQEMPATTETLSGDTEGPTSIYSNLWEKGFGKNSIDSQATEGQESVEELLRRDCDNVTDIHATTDLGDDQPGGDDSVPSVLDDSLAAIDGEPNGGQEQESVADS